MDVDKITKFWTKEADESLQVAGHLFEKKDYSYSLFFGHLAIEKLLKAIYVSKNKEHAPYIHNLQRLAEISNVSISDDLKDKLIRITRFNIETRYPDEKRKFRNQCSEEFTKNEMSQIEGLYKWLKSML
ncbi:MAG: HEPN domain-containing protein [bacterium]